MDDEVREQLSKYFDQAGKAFPDLVTNATPLNYGTFGLTLAYPDHSVRKLLFHHHDHAFTQSIAEDGFKREVETLRILSGSAASGFIPELLDEPEYFDPDTGFWGSYVMSRIDGATPTWRADKIAQTLKEYDFTHMAQSAGSLIARFHNVAEETEGFTPPTPIMKHHYGHDVRTLPHISDEENERLEYINRYLQENIITGTVHGDVHGNNIVVDEIGGAIGLLDFARTATNGNIYYDFASVPDSHLDDFVRGYKQERDIDFDKRTRTATLISCFTNYIHDLIDRGEEKEAKERSQTVGELIQDFDEISP